MNICGRSSDPKTTLKNIDGRGGNRGGDGCYLRINYSNAVMGSYDHMIMIMGSLRIALKIQSLSLSVNAFLQICLYDFSLTNSPMIRDK